MLGRLLKGRQGMLLRSIRGTEWQQFVDYVSPSFLEVMPVGKLVTQGRELVANAADGGRFEAVRERADAALRERGIALRVVPPSDARATPPAHPAELPEETRRALGQRALEAYFAQLYAGDTTILDLRGARLAPPEGAADALWFPRPFYLTWDADFLAAIRELYRGFFRDEEERFGKAMAQLDLEAAGDVFRSHFGFGEDDQRAVRFRSEVFHSTFHQAFVSCRDAGVSLHRNFLALGIYLACLYDGLEALDLAFDVREAFERGVG